MSVHSNKCIEAATSSFVRSLVAVVRSFVRSFVFATNGFVCVLPGCGVCLKSRRRRNEMYPGKGITAKRNGTEARYQSNQESATLLHRASCIVHSSSLCVVRCGGRAHCPATAVGWFALRCSALCCCARREGGREAGREAKETFDFACVLVG